jgi:hypothetical protein
MSCETISCSVAIDPFRKKSKMTTKCKKERSYFLALSTHSSPSAAVLYSSATVFNPKVRFDLILIDLVPFKHGLASMVAAACSPWCPRNNASATVVVLFLLLG